MGLGHQCANIDRFVSCFLAQNSIMRGLCQTNHSAEVSMGLCFEREGGREGEERELELGGGGGEGEERELELGGGGGREGGERELELGGGGGGGRGEGARARRRGGRERRGS